MTDLRYETGKVAADIAHGNLRPGFDMHQAIRKRLYPIAGDQPTCVRHDLLLPRSVPDVLARWDRLCADFVDAELPQQQDRLTITTFRLDPDEPLHVGWERTRNFCLAHFVLSEVRAPVLLVQHDPGEAGRSSPPHCHAHAFSRGFRHRWGPFHDLTKPGAKARIATAWAEWLIGHP
jgi:hypothetical protein